jgi:ABC-type Fe3+/spermidine/putrescine transport system ATPase subunit
MKPLINCRGLVCRLGGHLVLSGAELDVAQGQSLALLGSSGSGKSTLLRVIAGLEIPLKGEVLIAGSPATRGGRLLIVPYRRSVAMLFQDLALWPNLTVSGNVYLGLSGLHLPRGQLRDRAEEAMKMCGIADLSDRLPGTLSGGQQQRVALARALAMQPKLLLLDEPFGGLDLVTKEAIIRELVRLRAKLGLALILVTHDPLEVRELCDSLAVLQGGRIAEQGPLDDIARRPQTALAKALIQQLADRG